MQMIKIGEYYAKTEELVNCFYSFFILEEILYSVHRRHRLFSYEHWPQKESDNISQIISANDQVIGVVRINPQRVIIHMSKLVRHWIKSGSA
ncbi:MAG: hypothetical protein AAF518_24865, partial [Spirochaetota bacterium]